MKKQITNNQYLQIIGLLTLARRHNRALKEIERVVAEITGEPDEGGGYFGHSSDAVCSDYAADKLLKRLEIGVRPATKKERQ